MKALSLVLLLAGPAFAFEGLPPAPPPPLAADAPKAEAPRAEISAVRSRLGALKNQLYWRRWDLQRLKQSADRLRYSRQKDPMLESDLSRGKFDLWRDANESGWTVRDLENVVLKAVPDAESYRTAQELQGLARELLQDTDWMARDGQDIYWDLQFADGSLVSASARFDAQDLNNHARDLAADARSLYQLAAKLAERSKPAAL